MPGSCQKSSPFGGSSDDGGFGGFGDDDGFGGFGDDDDDGFGGFGDDDDDDFGGGFGEDGKYVQPFIFTKGCINGTNLDILLQFDLCVNNL